jgi:hypothetical protein
MSSWVFWVALACLVIGIVLLVVYCIEHFDKKQKTTKNQTLIAAGAALFIIGVGLMIYYFVAKGKSTKTKTLVDTNVMLMNNGPVKMSALNRGGMSSSEYTPPMNNYTSAPVPMMMTSEYTPPMNNYSSGQGPMSYNSSGQGPMMMGQSSVNYSGGSLSPRYNGNSGWM